MPSVLTGDVAHATTFALCCPRLWSVIAFAVPDGLACRSRFRVLAVWVLFAGVPFAVIPARAADTVAPPLEFFEFLGLLVEQDGDWIDPLQLEADLLNDLAEQGTPAPAAVNLEKPGGQVPPGGADGAPGNPGGPQR